MYTLTISIQEEDIGLFYEALAQYHKDPVQFRDLIREGHKGNEERHEKSIKETKEEAITTQEIPTLFSHITNTCVCGKCYQALVRSDRVPWRCEDNHFINAKHGTYTPPKYCKTANTNISGYIYESYEILERQNKNAHKLKLTELEFETKRSAVELKKADASSKVAEAKMKIREMNESTAKKEEQQAVKDEKIIRERNAAWKSWNDKISTRYSRIVEGHGEHDFKVKLEELGIIAYNWDNDSIRMVKPNAGKLIREQIIKEDGEFEYPRQSEVDRALRRMKNRK